MYLDRESAKEKKIIARFKCGNEERNNTFWVSEGETMCRICGEGRETIEHMLHDCEECKVRESVREILNEDGRGVEWRTRLRLGQGGRREKKSYLAFKMFYLVFVN
ncbi:hypothetical protein Zmor_021016 [Zophobas morio]|uniref:Uncharacterized protein n=1 Tax=Zophobas morio TaxID=2755281 RepID=A0AA38I4H3_9CUCU|nr:hypothetical protein Zmor_021016 [Zophobas morio]